ncbi:MAG: short-subunit dehydrogenase [Halieaceae bacterium]|jgi:short-subunit dehydrogenase
MKISGRALVTGASSGIGEEFVRSLAGHCEHIVVVARRAERLEGLAASLASQCRVEALQADLASTEGQARVIEHIRQGPALDLLVNNAGFSTLGPFASSLLDRELEMLRLHQDATLALTRAALPGMIEAGHGAIINVASVAAFLQVPGVAVYGATKAFLLSYSRSLRAELAGSGVLVQCLCPGYTRTEIHSRDSFAGFDVSRVPGDMWMETDEVVAQSLQALAEDRWLVVPGEANRALAEKGLGELVDALGSASA